MDLKGRDFLKLLDFTPEEIEYLLDLAADLKDKKKKDRYSKVAWFVAGSAFTVAGFIFIPPLIQKYAYEQIEK